MKYIVEKSNISKIGNARLEGYLVFVKRTTLQILQHSCPKQSVARQGRMSPHSFVKHKKTAAPVCDAMRGFYLFHPILERDSSWYVQNVQTMF